MSPGALTVTYDQKQWVKKKVTPRITDFHCVEKKKNNFIYQKKNTPICH